MAYDEYLADRVKHCLRDKEIDYAEKKMMGGLCIMMDDKMLVGIVFNKKAQTDVVMARIGPDVYKEALNTKGCLPMDFTGRPMKGFVFVGPEGYDTDEDLEYWIDLCIAYNPFAKSSKKKKKQ